MHAECKDTCALRYFPDSPRCLNAVQLRHGDIHNDDVGLKLRRKLNGFAAVRRFSDHLQVVLRLEDEAEAAANY